MPEREYKHEVPSDADMGEMVKAARRLDVYYEWPADNGSYEAIGSTIQATALFCIAERLEALVEAVESHERTLEVNLDHIQHRLAGP